MNTKTKLTTAVVRKLQCVLDDREKRDFGRKLADLEYSRDQIELEKKASSDGFKEKLSTVEAEVRVIATAIRDGQIRRDVDCEWVYFWNTLTKQLVRKDTGEIIESDVITADERQLGLDGIDANA